MNERNVRIVRMYEYVVQQITIIIKSTAWTATACRQQFSHKRVMRFHRVLMLPFGKWRVHKQVGTRSYVHTENFADVYLIFVCVLYAVYCVQMFTATVSYR